ncbi:hypothetical protein CAPTEDRAFT_227139 [Capitella teleta]|uniref:PLAT domain-containing protein n=1 Tax=Capitella teleta TaxID=283909 RepID=R7UBW4_CAPTE|nr:hypothetical protein CAPTEDRAFT_227139 [Capitella teleta]|eukprot:ELU03454.1 hypothetical protein CAPTEDRAFT_227139 [Capitella teleta]
MSSNDVLKSVSKKLKYYFQVKRLEDGFDLSGPECPKLDHPPLKARPTLMYDGLHDRPLKHYFSPHDVRTVLTQFKTDDQATEAEFDIEPPGHEGREKEIRKALLRQMQNCSFVPNTLAESYYTKGKKGRKLKSTMQGMRVPLRKHKQLSPHATIRGGYPVLRAAPSTNMSLGEAQRLVNVASKLLVVTVTDITQETIDLQSGNTDYAEQEEQKNPRLPRVNSSNGRPKSSKCRKKEAPLNKGHSIYTYDPSGKRILLKKDLILDSPLASSRMLAEYRKSLSPCLRRRIKRKRGPEEDGASSSNQSDGSRVNGHNVVTIDGTKASDEQVKPWLRKEMHKTEVNDLDSDDAVVRVPHPPTAEHTQRPKSSLRRRPDSQTSYSSSSASSSVSSSSDRTFHGEEIAVQTGPELLHDYDPEADILTEGDSVTYQINVCTGSCIGASTRAEVKIVLIGQNGRTEEIYLEDSKLHKVPFQKGQEDEFRVKCFDLGRLKRIIIGHDRKQIACGWFLDRVRVRDLKARVEYLVLCDKWLSSTDGDGITFKEFPVTGASGYKDVSAEVDNAPTPPSSPVQHVRSEPRVMFSEATDSKYSMDPEATLRAESPKLENSATSFNDSSKDSRLKTLERHLEEQRKPSPASPSNFKSPRVPRRDDFFDQSVREKDYSSVIESLSTATDQDNRDDFVSDHVDSHQGEKLSTEPRLRHKPRAVRESEEEKNRPLDDDTARISTSAIDCNQGHLFMDGFQAGLAASKQAEPKVEVKKEVSTGPSIHTAAKNGDLNRLKEIVELRPEDKTRPNEQGWTPLHLAANFGQIDIVQYLSITVVDLDMTTPTGFTAMHMAARSGHTACMKVLSAMGAAIDSLGVDECTPLHQAAVSGHLDCVKWLVANGASVSAVNLSGANALELAIRHQQEDVARFLRACEDDRANPESSLAQIANRSDDEPQSRTTGSPTVTPSHGSAEYSSEDDEPIQRTLSKAEQQKYDAELEEKKKLYERQEDEKLRRDSSFLDSIRQQYEEVIVTAFCEVDKKIVAQDIVIKSHEIRLLMS